MMQGQHWRRETPGSAGVGGVATIVLLVIFLYLVRRILLPFAIAGIIAFVCAPLTDWLAARTRLPRWLFALAVLLVLIGAGTLLVVIAAPDLLQTTARVGANLEGEIQHLIQALFAGRKLTLGTHSPLDAAQLAHSAVTALRGWVSSDKIFLAAAWGFSALFGLILTAVLLAYFLLDTRRIAQGLLWLIPPGQQHFVRRVWTELDPILRRYFIGIAVVVVYACAAAYIGLGLILHLHHAGFLALLTGLLELLPLVGPGISALLGGLVAVREAASAWNVLGYVMYAIALRISIDQLFGPLVLGRAARVHPVVVIFCFLSGAMLFGITGVILAVPVALGIKVTLAIRYTGADTSTT